MTSYDSTTTRRRRLTAALLALPLALAMTGTASATGSTTAELRVASAGAEKPSDARKSDAAPSAAKRDAPGPRAEPGSASERKAEPKSEPAVAKAEPAVSKADPRPEPKAEPQAERKADPEPEPKPEPKAEPKPAPKAATAPEARTAPAGAKNEPARPTAGAAASGSSSADKHGTATRGPLTSPQPLSGADKKGTGANPGPTCTHTYCSTRDGAASQNGNGGGGAGGKPCAGCVGKADNKNPRGQAPGGSDRNNGYECDGNRGVGKTNPAHTGCTTPAPSPTRSSVPPVHCPGTTTPAPGGDVRDCPKPPKTCPDGSTPKAGSSCEKGKQDEPESGKITICHATGSATNPYVVLTISENALAAHRDHQAGRDIIPAPASGICPAGAPPVDACPDLGGVQLPGTSCTTPPTGTGGGGVTVPLCPNGAVAPEGDRKNCPTTPPVCPTDATMGPVMAGCNPPPGETPPTFGGGTPISGTPGNQPVTRTPPVVGPPTTVPPVIVPRGNRPPTLLGTVSSPASRAAVRPRALPFTGTDAALLVELGALLLLAGGGLLLTARRERTARVR